jgi:transposase
MKHQQGLVMNQVVEIARLHESGLNKSEIHRAINIARPTIDLYLKKFQELGLKYDDMKNMPWEILRKKIFPSQPSNKKKLQPKWDKVYEEMKRPNVTLFLLWSEFIALNQENECISYSRFCKYYNQYLGNKKITMRQSHQPGEKTFIDFAGTTIPITNRDTGEVTKAQIFISTLGFSNYTFAYALESQSLESFLFANSKSFKFFGGVPAISVPDNLKSAVHKACIYDPLINPVYQEFAIYYDTTVVPARARKPQDKAKVENAVLNVSRQILAALRDRTFYDLAELNIAIKEFLEKLNSRPQQNGRGSRKEVFEIEEKHFLKPLPIKDFEYVAWKKATVGIDYHVQLDKHHYSVPAKYAHQVVELRYNQAQLTVLKDGVIIAQHLRGISKSNFSTIKEHMPLSHQEYSRMTPAVICKEASKIGINTLELISKTFASRTIPETSSRQCLGVISLVKKFSIERIEIAAKILLTYGVTNNPYQKMKSILQREIDKKYIHQEQSSLNLLVLAHENIRGEKYYQ